MQSKNVSASRPSGPMQSDRDIHGDANTAQNAYVSDYSAVFAFASASQPLTSMTSPCLLHAHQAWQAAVPVAEPPRRSCLRRGLDLWHTWREIKEEGRFPRQPRIPFRPTSSACAPASSPNMVAVGSSFASSGQR
jgi:hypothetical protein